MRKHLFRGKRLSGGEWVQGGIAAAYHTAGDPFALDEAQGYAILADGRAYAVEQESIGEYSGLQDAEGLEIFEGDLVAGDFSGTHQIFGVVRFGLYGTSKIGSPNQGWWIEWNEEFWRPELAWWQNRMRVIGPVTDHAEEWEQRQKEGKARDSAQGN